MQSNHKTIATTVVCTRYENGGWRLKAANRIVNQKRIPSGVDGASRGNRCDILVNRAIATATVVHPLSCSISTTRRLSLIMNFFAFNWLMRRKSTPTHQAAHQYRARSPAPPPPPRKPRKRNVLPSVASRSGHCAHDCATWFDAVPHWWIATRGAQRKRKRKRRKKGKEREKDDLEEEDEGARSRLQYQNRSRIYYDMCEFARETCEKRWGDCYVAFYVQVTRNLHLDEPFKCYASPQIDFLKKEKVDEGAAKANGSRHGRNRSVNWDL